MCFFHNYMIPDMTERMLQIVAEHPIVKEHIEQTQGNGKWDFIVLLNSQFSEFLNRETEKFRIE